jgi:YD repeat-containing protein
MARIATVIVCVLLLSGSVAFGADILYAYDSQGRVVRVTYPDGKFVRYCYDKAGNRTRVFVNDETACPPG